MNSPFPQLPSPEKIASALSSFPPKISSIAEALVEPENFIESTLTSMGLPTPPGPMKTAAQMLQSVESMISQVPSPLPAPQSGAASVPPATPRFTLPSIAPAPAKETQAAEVREEKKSKVKAL